MAHAAGPIIALHLLPQKLERQMYFGTCAVYFFIVNTAKAPVYVSAHQFRADMIRPSLYVLPSVFIGALFGFWLAKQLNEKLFARIIYTLTFFLGRYLLYDGIGILRSASTIGSAQIVSTKSRLAITVMLRYSEGSGPFARVGQMLRSTSA